MKRSALAVAVGALFIAPAAHSQIVFGNPTIGTVQLYGKLYPQFSSFKADGATAVTDPVSTLVVVSPFGVNLPQRMQVDTQNSYIGFRGERSIGGGLKALWQVEQSVGLDGSGDVWSNRNSFGGFSGGFGTVKLGNMDTIYKEYGDTFSMFGVKSGNFMSASNVLSHIGTGTSATARFHERRASSLQYQSPEMGGLQVGVQYGPDEGKTSTKDATLWSYGVKYDAGRFYLSVQHEKHDDFFGGSNNVNPTLSNATTPGAHSKDTATRFSGEWRMGSHKLVFDYAMMEWQESGQAAGTRFEKYEKKAWAIGWEASWGGPWRTAVQVVSADKGECRITGGSCSADGLKGKMLSAAVAYNFDRATLLYFAFTNLKNEPSAQYDNWANGTPARGSDPQQFALGMSYTF
jgi:predicted porin